MLLLASSGAEAQRTLRVCADPNNLPFSASPSSDVHVTAHHGTTSEWLQ
jgi:hypothetical protein